MAAALLLVLLLSSVVSFQNALAAAASVTITGPTEVTGASFEVVVTFSEGVTGFTQSDVTVTNGSTTGFSADSATAYRVTIAPTAGFSGAVTVDVPAGAAQSISDNADNLAATQFSTTATFASACATGSAVSDKTNTGLIADCAALLAARDTLRGTATLNWSANASISSWEGVYIGASQRVGTVSLSDKGLDGSIPAALSRLTVLTDLLLSTNQLSGAIPTELKDLANLTKLHLNENRLTGRVPKELGNLANLTSLHLAHNQLTGGIPKELGNLANLTGLYLLNNQLTGGIPRELGNLANLTHLELDQNQLSGSIPTELGDLANLTVLHLHENQLSGSIPRELGNLSNLTLLRLYKNQLDGSIPTELGDLANLTVLHLHENQLIGAIPRELGNLTALTNLYLYTNQLSGAIPTELGKLSSLTSLLLGTNQLSGTIPTELGNLTNLISLWLHENRLTGPIPVELGSLTALQYLLLNHNQLSSSIPTELSSLTSVQYLRLQCNQLTGTIPDSLGALTALVEADFRGNHIEGGIPASMAGLPVKLDEAIACARDPVDPSETTTGTSHDSESDWPPRLTVSLTCPAGPVTEGDTLRCTLTLRNTGGETLTNINWRLPMLGVDPQTLTTGWPRDPPGALKPGRAVKLQLVYGPLSPRRGQAALTLTPVLSNGVSAQPTRLALPWPAPLPLMIIADSAETDPATVTHVVEVQALTPETLADDDDPTAQATMKSAVGVVDEVTVTATAGPPPGALLHVELKGRQEPANDGQLSDYTLTITNASRFRWLTGLHWWSPTLRIRRQVGDDGRLRPGETVVMKLPSRPANFRRLAPLMMSVIVASVQTGAVAVTHVADAGDLARKTTVGNQEPTAAADEKGVKEEVLATARKRPPRAPLQVELRGSEEPVAVGQNAHYTLIVTNTSRYWLLTKLRWHSPTLGIDRQKVDGTLRPGETVVTRLAYGPAHFRWQPATLAAGRVYNWRDEPRRLEYLSLPWLAPLPLMIIVDGKLRISENEYRRVTTHASYVSALHTPPLTLQSVPGPAGHPASGGIPAAREVHAVPVAAPLHVTFWDALNPRTPMYGLLADFLGKTVYPLPQIRAPAGVLADTDTILTAYLFVAPPAPLERAPVGDTTAMLDMTPVARIGGQFVKRREYDNGVVRSLVGNTVTVLSLLDADGDAVTLLDKPLELRTYLPGSRLPPGVTLAGVYWARWDATAQRWQPLPTRNSDRLLIGATQQLGLFGVIAATPPSRDLESGLRYFFTTGKHVGFAFKEYFDAHGGVARFGYPVTNEFQQNGATMQYFAKARFEYRPHLAGTPAAVTLGLLGDELLTLWDAHQPRTAEPSQDLPPTVQYFPETGHYVAHGFLKYFNANGGVERFGFPVTEEVYDPNLGRTVQYFQRQRLAWNAETGRVEEMPDIARVLILAGDPIR